MLKFLKKFTDFLLLLHQFAVPLAQWCGDRFCETRVSTITIFIDFRASERRIRFAVPLQAFDPRRVQWVDDSAKEGCRTMLVGMGSDWDCQCRQPIQF